MQDRADRRSGGDDLDGEAAEDDDQQRDDEGLEVAEAPVHQQQHEEGVERRQARAADQRNAEQELQRDRRADHLGQVAGDDRQLAGDPEHEVDRSRIVVAAGLGEVAAGGDAEPGGERLQQDRHQVRQHDDEEQRVAELGAAGEVGRPVARIHVADRDHVARPHEGEQAAEPDASLRHRDRGVDLAQAGLLIFVRPGKSPH